VVQGANKGTGAPEAFLVLAREWLASSSVGVFLSTLREMLDDVAADEGLVVVDQMESEVSRATNSASTWVSTTFEHAKPEVDVMIRCAVLWPAGAQLELLAYPAGGEPVALNKRRTDELGMLVLSQVPHEWEYLSATDLRGRLNAWTASLLSPEGEESVREQMTAFLAKMVADQA